jgi:SAM-dependent methyltransferase
MVAADPGDLRHAACHLHLQPAVGFPLMERVVYQQMAELDDRHWWYRARRRILADLIRREARPPANAQILEIGCGTGHNLEMLGEFGHVDGLELDEEARALSEKRLGRRVMSSPLPELAEVANRHYDLIGAFDVIEHIEDDRAALACIATKLKPGGKFVMAVPAHQCMWSAHDVVNHHKRRYSKAALRALIEGSPLQLVKIGYFNSLLFPLAMAERATSKLRGKENADVRLPPAPLNAALEKVFEAERYLVGRLPLPPGLSLFAIASAK